MPRLVHEEELSEKKLLRGLDKLFRPRSVAIVGASGRVGSLMSRPLQYLIEHGFSGPIYPINPNCDQLEGIPCYPSLSHLPEPVDLVVILVSASKAAGVVREAGVNGASVAIVFASGFGEAGAVGARHQRALLEAARESGVRVLGPNCQGAFYGPASMVATFTAAAARPMVGAGQVAYVGQSGGIGGSVLDLAREMELGLAAWVSTGNQVDIDLIEVAMALVRDDAVRVIMLFAEEISDGKAYASLASEARDVGKSIVALSTGRSDAGQRAASSHTGSMLNDDIAFQLTSERYGVVLVDDVDELLNVAFSESVIRGDVGRRVAILTTSGGAGILAADHCVSNGLVVPELPDDLQRALAHHLPNFGALSNPIDVTAELFSREGYARVFGEVCRMVAQDSQIDQLAIVWAMVADDLAVNLARELVVIAEQIQKPLFVSWMAGLELTAEGRKVLRAGGVPVFPTASDLARTMGLLARSNLQSGRASIIVESAEEVVNALRGSLKEGSSGREVLTTLGISQPRWALTTTAAEAEAVAGEFGGLVAMKIESTALHHKSDVGGVRLNTPVASVRQTFEQLMKLTSEHGIESVEGILVQEMTPPGVELIIGATNSAQGYAPVISVGMGGTLAELRRDVVSAIAPVGIAGAEEMLRKLSGWPLLSGFRGAPPADVDAAVRVLVSLSSAVMGITDIGFEFEVNPLVVLEDGRGAFAVDVLLKKT